MEFTKSVRKRLKSEDALDTSLNAVQETLQDTLREREDGGEGGSAGFNMSPDLGFNMSMLVATKMTASPDGQEKGGGAGGETKVG